MQVEHICRADYWCDPDSDCDNISPLDKPHKFESNPNHPKHCIFCALPEDNEDGVNRHV